MAVGPCPNCKQAAQAFKAAETKPSAVDSDFFAAAPKASEATATPTILPSAPVAARAQTESPRSTKQAQQPLAQPESSYQSPKPHQGAPSTPMMTSAPQVFQTPLPSLFRHQAASNDGLKSNGIPQAADHGATLTSTPTSTLPSSPVAATPQASPQSTSQASTSEVRSMPQASPQSMAEGAAHTSTALFSTLPTIATAINTGALPTSITTAPLSMIAPQILPLLLPNPIMMNAGILAMMPMMGGITLKTGVMSIATPVGMRVPPQTLAAMPGPLMRTTEVKHEARDGLIRHYVGALEKIFRRERRRKVASAVDGSELALEESSESGASDNNTHS